MLSSKKRTSIFVAKHISSELTKRSGYDFQTYFASLLGELVDGSAETRRLGSLNRMGVDAFILDGDQESISTAIQCKGFELFEYGADQHHQCRAEIAKFMAKGPKAARYSLVLNRPIKDRTLRDQLESDLSGLVRRGKVAEAELLDRPPAHEASGKTGDGTPFVMGRNETRRTFSILQRTDGNCPPHRSRAVQQSVARSLRFPHGAHEFFLQGNCREPDRQMPARAQVTSEFGFGKTTTLQTLAQSWIASGLADSLLQFILPDDPDLSDAALLTFRNVLRDLLARSKDWLLVIDGLVENSYAFLPNSLARLWNVLRTGVFPPFCRRATNSSMSDLRIFVQTTA